MFSLFKTLKDIATKLGNKVSKSGDTMTGNLTVPTVNGDLNGNASTATTALYATNNKKSIALNKIPTTSGWYRMARFIPYTTGHNWLVAFETSYNSPHDAGFVLMLSLGYGGECALSVLSCESVAQVSQVRLTQDSTGSEYYLEFYFNATTYNNFGFITAYKLSSPSDSDNYCELYDKTSAGGTVRKIIHLYSNMSVFCNSVYTTSEIQIGTWIDGKPLYRKVITASGIANNSATATGISNLKDLVKCSVVSKNTPTGTIIPLTYASQSANEYWTYYLSANATELRWRIAPTSYNNLQVICIIEYTKTTD